MIRWFWELPCTKDLHAHTHSHDTWAAIRLTDWNFESINTNLYPMHGNIFFVWSWQQFRGKRMKKNPNHTFFSCNFLCVFVCSEHGYIYLCLYICVRNWIQSQLKYVLFIHVYCVYRVVYITLMNTRYQFISCFFDVVAVGGAAVFASHAPHSVCEALLFHHEMCIMSATCVESVNDN